MQPVARSQRGFGLADALLAVSIAGLALSAAIPLILAGQDELNGRSVADDLIAFQQLAAQHFMSNRQVFEAAMLDGNGADNLCRLDMVPGDAGSGRAAWSLARHTCALDQTVLLHAKSMPTDMHLGNRHGERWIAIFRLVHDQQTPPQPTGAVDMLVVSADLASVPKGPSLPDERRHRELVSAVAYMGGTGGLVPDADRSTCISSRAQARYEACGNGWKVALSDFVDAEQMAQFASRLWQ